MHERNCFLTLTYDEEHLPSDGKISKKHFKQFIRKLHRRLTRKVRYFGCGEYGDQTGRPHYHAILFGEDFRDGHFDINGSMYGNAVLSKIWGHGQTTIAPAEIGSCMYTAGYVAKKTGDTDTFALQSRNPPIGKTWWSKYHDNIRRLEQINVGGKELPVPRAYIDWFKSEQFETYEKLKENRLSQARTLNDRQLYAKKRNLQAKTNLKQEKL